MGDAFVIHPGALGDVLLAVPALRVLRASGELTIAAQPRIGALLVALGVADRAVAFETLGLDALFSDAPLAAHAPFVRHVEAARQVVCWFGARDQDFVRRFRSLAPDAVIAPPHTRAEPVWRHLLHTVGAGDDTAGGDLRDPVTPGTELIRDGRRALQDAGWDGVSRVLVVHPGAGGVTKRWLTEGFIEVTEAVDATIVVSQGPADADAVEAYLTRMRREVVRLIDPSLPALAGIFRHAAAYLGNDSGVSHLAAAVGAPSIILFTEPSLPWAPWSSTARCLPVVAPSELVGDERRAISAALSGLL